ncbi:hypothetical protein Pint_20219 [Pistacia integerrima]|uniref:Uncharacterized protein n=1 Tax=Pistacia integerrima TaxID=434235 RepID=A0ACC0XFE8_9ROSI|nr:hypothetical protein Pint_20219 [Pistacia integerrima]
MVEPLNKNCTLKTFLTYNHAFNYINLAANSQISKIESPLMSSDVSIYCNLNRLYEVLVQASIYKGQTLSNI